MFTNVTLALLLLINSRCHDFIYAIGMALLMITLICQSVGGWVGPPRLKYLNNYTAMEICLDIHVLQRTNPNDIGYP